MVEHSDALARLAENLLERLRSEEEPSAETLTAARLMGRRMRASGLAAEQIIRSRLQPDPSGLGTTEAVEAKIMALKRAKLRLERENAALRIQCDQAHAEREAAETMAKALRAGLRRSRERMGAERASDTPGMRKSASEAEVKPSSSASFKARPTQTAEALEHARRSYWRIQAIQRAEPRASPEALADSLNEQGWSTVAGLPWTRDSIRHVIEHLQAQRH